MEKVKVNNKYTQAIEEYLEKTPQGATFGKIGRELKIPDSTLDRALKLLLKEGSIVKNRAYYPAGANLAIPTFRQLMDIMKDAAKTLRAGQAGISPINEAKVRIALGELTGVPGHPSPYPYHALPDDSDILTLENVLEAMADGKLAGLETFTESLSQFIAGALRFRIEHDKSIPPPLVANVRGIEHKLFNGRHVLSGMESGKIDSAWMFIYGLLCDMHDRQVGAVLDRILDYVDESRQENSKGEHLKDTSAENLDRIERAIRNDLWCGQLKEVMFRRQLEFFQSQLKNASRPALADFYGDLRGFAMEDSAPRYPRKPVDWPVPFLNRCLITNMNAIFWHNAVAIKITEAV